MASIETPNDQSSRKGLLSLPAELRLEVYRHLLVQPRPISTDYCQPFPAILRTCAQIRSEAFQVMYE